jgi:hypothetical protein
MNINKSPYSIAPVGNPVIFSFSATTADTRLFQVSIKEPFNNTTIYTGKVYPTPLNTTEAFLNASNILSSLVRHDFDNTNILLIPKPKNFQTYYLDINEYGINNTTGQLEVITSGYTSSGYTVYESRLNVPYWSKTLTPTTYPMTNSINQNYKFLTNRPDYVKVNEYSTEQLYFLKKPEGNFSTTITQNKIESFGTTSANRTYDISDVPGGLTFTIESTAYVTFFIDGDFSNSYSIYGSGGAFASYNAVLIDLAANINAYPHGYTATVDGTNITIIAPLSGGATYNGYYNRVFARGNTILPYYDNQLPLTGGVSTNIVVTNVVYIQYATTSNGAASAEVTFDFNSYAGLFPEFGFNAFTVTVDDPNYGFIGICGTSGPGFITLQDALDYYVASLNGNSYGYSATTSGGFMTVIAPISLGQSINGNNCGWSITIGAVTEGGQGQFEGGVDTNELEYRLQVSPKKLAISGLTFAPGDTYTINVNNIFDQPISEYRHYIYEDTECNVDYVNILFSNSVGGVDSIQMKAPKMNFTNDKKNILRNNLNVESETPYLTDEVYNQQKSIYANTISSQITLSTNYLNDLESEWLVELLNSQNIYIELNDGDLLPVVMVNNDYAMKKKKYQSNEFISYDFTFELPTNFFNLYDNTISIIQNN